MCRLLKSRSTCYIHQYNIDNELKPRKNLNSELNFGLKGPKGGIIMLRIMLQVTRAPFWGEGNGKRVVIEMRPYLTEEYKV